MHAVAYISRCRAVSKTGAFEKRHASEEEQQGCEHSGSLEMPRQVIDGSAETA